MRSAGTVANDTMIAAPREGFSPARKRYIGVLSGSLLLAAIPATVRAAEGLSAQGAGRGGGRTARGEITPALRLAVSRGIQHLIRKQHRLGTGDFDSQYPVATGALVGLAFLAGGHSERAGEKYTAIVRETTSRLLQRQNTSGYFHDGRSQMYGHGFATLYLAELYGTSRYRSRQIRAALVKAIRVIEGSQGSSGGWDYEPKSRFAIQGIFSRSRNSDTSITVCQTMALRAARSLGIRVENRVIGLAQRYIGNMQNDDGGFKYRQDLQLSSAFPRSAAGVCILYSLGYYNTERLRDGFEYLRRNYRFPWSNQFPFYAHYYCSQAMFQAGGPYWEEYFRWIRGTLLEHQKADGSWPTTRPENPVQTTAMALIILQLPYRFLPIHER